MAASAVKQRKIDLGCGNSKVAADFIGVDRFPLPGVDIVADLNERLPFENDSIDFLFASHSLEHCADLLKTMQEIYRICRHGAQVCIASPYYSTHLNLSNPYHLQCFNEHTPRFWSNREHITQIPAEEWFFPHAESWYLGCSDHSDPGIDFRCVRMEFFYFPQYRASDVSRLRHLRKHGLDVCDQILYHLIVVKQPFENQSFDSLLTLQELFDPPFLAKRREADSGVPAGQKLLAGAWHATRNAQTSHSAVLSNKDIVTAPADFQTASYERLLAEADHLRAEIKQDLERVKAELFHSQRQLASALEQLRSNRETIELHRQEAHRYKQTSAYESQRNEQLEASYKALIQIRERSLGLTATSATFMQNSARTLERAIERYRGMPCVWDRIPASYQKLRDDALLFDKKRRSWGLFASENIQDIPYRSYFVSGVGREITRVLLAPVISNIPIGGILGVEIVNPLMEIVASGIVSSFEISPNQPLAIGVNHFQMDSKPGWELRVFARNFSIPVYILEFRRHTKLGFGKTAYLPFCAFDAEC